MQTLRPASFATDRFGLLRDKDKLQATKIYQLDADYVMPAPAQPAAAVPAAPVKQ